MKTLQAGLLPLICAALQLVLPAGRAATVTVCIEAELRAALAAGGTVTFGCNGTIALASPLVITGDVVLDGTGRSIALSGVGAVRLFEVSSIASLTLSNLALINGRSTNGGAVRNEGAFRAIGCLFSNNAVSGVSPVYSGPSLVPGSDGEGGAIWNAGTATVETCAFLRNTAYGANGPQVLESGGGTTLLAGAYAGNGGAICNLGQVAVLGCVFSNNAAAGGNGNPALSSPMLEAGRGGSGFGGAIFNRQTVSLQKSLLIRNGAYGGSGAGAAIGGDGSGGAVYNQGSFHSTNDTLCINEAAGAPSGSGPYGGGFGGGVCNGTGTLDIAFCTLASNYAGGGIRCGASLFSASNAATRLTHSIVAYSASFGVAGTNVCGPLVDLGYNLDSDAVGTFPGVGSLNGVDPMLAPLADNGGQTPTMALLKGSPAADAGSALAGPPTDQRGLSRPYGLRNDIGAVEGPVSAPVEPFPFSPANLVAGEIAYLILPVTNSNRGPLSHISVFYAAPYTVVIPTNTPLENDCAGTLQLQGCCPAEGYFALQVSQLNLEPGQGCFLRVPVRSSALGTWTGELLSVSSDQTGQQSSYGLQTVTVVGAPQGRTERQSNSGFAGATLNGRVNPGGPEAVAFFQYGLTTNFGSATPVQTLAAGLTEVPVSAAISGLASNTAFYFRVVASNSLGVLYGNVQSGFTLGDTVVVCDEGNLIPNVLRGGTVRFACDGQITLTTSMLIATNTVLDASGHQVTISGSNAVRLFQVAPGVRLNLLGLTLANGRATNGGAVFNQGTLEAFACVFTNNQALGQTGSAGEGGAVWNGAAAVLQECFFPNNVAVGGAGTGMAAFAGLPGNGGAVCNRGSVLISNCAFAGSSARGGVGSTEFFFPPGPGPGGLGQGGALYNAQSAIVRNSTFSANIGTGGYGGAGSLSTGGGNGGSGYGGAVFNAGGTLAVTNCTLHNNQATGGPGVTGRLGRGSDGQGFGGGVVQAGGSATFAFTTFAANFSTNGGGALHGASNAVVRLAHSILSRGSQGGNVSGSVEDLGYNLSSDPSVNLTNTGSVTMIDPKLGPLAFNGGPTPTLALLAGSPAIDAGAMTVDVTTDQRGFPRPAGSRSDIGAFEGSTSPLTVSIRFTPGVTSVAAVVTLEIAASNPNNFSFTGLRLTNSLSPSLSVAPGLVTAVGFNGTLTAVPGSRDIVLSGFSLGPSANCTVRVPVSADAVGSGNATVTGLQSDQLGAQSPGTTASLTVIGPPDGHTDAATGADFTSATLHGTVIPGGAATAVWFEYGTTTNFGQSTPLQSLPSGSTEVPVPAFVSGLPSTTDFFFRVAASNAFGSFRGNMRTFFTAGDVAVCDEAHLRANLVRGGRVRIVCDGVIGLSNTLAILTDTEVDATGQQVALSGNDAVRVFEVSPGVSLTLRNLTITRGRSTNGAGIYNAGTLTLDRCVLTANRAIGKVGTAGADSATQGVSGGFGETGGSAAGAALHNAGVCTAVWTTFSSNLVTGGIGGAGGHGGLPLGPAGPLPPGGVGGDGGLGQGGAILNASVLILSNCCVFGNRALGGAGGSGGANRFGALWIGGAGGPARGGGLGIQQQATLANTTLASNEVAGGNEGAGYSLAPGGSGLGGGISVQGTASLLNCTIAWNRATGGAPNGDAFGAGLATTGAVVMLENVILAHAPGGSNVFGPVVDAGHNLSSDDSGDFTDPSSLSNVDPGLGALTDAGGPTPSIPLLGSSPAIDAGAGNNCPPTDQRGRPRPALTGCDIGAFEVQSDFWLLSFKPGGTQTFRLRGIGLPGAGFRLQASDDLIHWIPSGSRVTGNDGLFEIEVSAGNSIGQFFRAVSP